MCPSGYTLSDGQCKQYFVTAEITPTLDAGRNAGASCPKEGNPVNPATGNKFQIEPDYAGAGAYPLAFTRTYNSAAPQDGPLGAGWQHGYARRLRAEYTAPPPSYTGAPGQSSLYASAQAACESGWAQVRGQLTAVPGEATTAVYEAGGCQIYYNGVRWGRAPLHTDPPPQHVPTLIAWHAVRADGKTYRFTPGPSGTWQAEADVPLRLEETAEGFRLTDAQDRVETYDTTGRLLAITHPSGATESLGYDGAGRLSTITNPFGQSLALGYDAAGRLSTLTDPAQGETGYSYDAAGNLERVTRPDGTVRVYHYEDARFPRALTGITDERNVRYATYQYDAQGRATVTEHASGAGRVTLTYNTDGTTTATNSRGATTTYHFATALGAALPTLIEGPGCASCGNGESRYTYDAANHLLTKTEHGVTTEYGDYDAKGNPGYVIEAAGTPQARRTDYTYDLRFYGKVATKTEPSVYTGAVKTTTYGYDDLGNLTGVIVSGYTPDGVPVSRTTTYSYNGPLHQLSTIDGPRTDVSDITTFEYYADDPAEGYNRARLKRVVSPTGLVLRDNIQYSATGKAVSETRPNGLALTYTYYAGNDRLESLTEAGGSVSRTTHWTYLATGEVASITLGYGTAAATTLTFGYDAARRLERVTDGAGNYIQYALDPEGNREAESVYDATHALKRALTATFDLYNRLDTTSQANETSDYDFAANGTLDRVTDGRGAVSDLSYDALKRLIGRTADLGGADPATANALTQYGYDAADRLTTVIAPNGAATQYTYDDLGNLLSEASPDRGPTTYTHDAAGNVIGKTDALDQTFAYTYDAANRLLRVTAPVPADTLLYTYDSCPNGLGRLCAVRAGDESVPDAVVVSYAYNAFGQVTAHQGVGYGYDAAGRLSTITYPSGAQVAYSYDAAGQVSGVSLTRAGQTTPLASAITHAPFGPLTGLAYGNGLAFSRTLDTAYRETALSVPGALALTNLQYDGAGNLTARTDAIAGVTESYGYDALARLTSASGAFGTRGYAYDANGNRTGLTDDAGSTSYGYTPASNRLAAIDATPVTLDAAGNTRAQAGQSYTYTAHQRLATAGGANYRYNGLGERVEKVYNGATTRYVYGLDGALLAETDAAGTVQVEYVYLEGVPLAVHYASGAVPLAYVHPDPLGTPRSLTDAAGVVVWHAAYDPFGAATVDADPDGDGQALTFNLRFPGQYYDAETGLHYNVNRYYAPGSGRYLASDPIGLAGGLNPYVYANANPLRYVDPTGLFVGDPAEWTAVVKAVEAASSITASTIAAGVAGVVAAVYPRPVGEGSDVVPKNCPPDDECEKLRAQIKAHIEGMKQKYYDLAKDPKDLFHKAFETNPGGSLADYGTWKGHIERYEGLRVGLARMIRRAVAMGCAVPPEAYDWLNKPAPLVPYL